MTLRITFEHTGSLPRTGALHFVFEVQMINRYDKCLRWVIKPRYTPHTSLQSSTTISELKNPTEVSRVVNMPEDFPSDLILTLLDSSLSEVRRFNDNGDRDRQVLTSFRNQEFVHTCERAMKISKRIQKMCQWQKLTRFWTLTFYEELNYQQRLKTFNRFTTRLRKKRPDLEYICVKEFHRSGQLHLHGFFNQYVPYALVREIWEGCGAGKVLHVQFVPPDRVVQYVCKYITKSIKDGVRRVVIYSRGLCLHLSNWPKWLMTNLVNKNISYIKYFLDSGDLLEYACIVGKKKRDTLSQVLALL